MEKEESKLFREKSLERISSPDELDKYLKSSSPAIWILMISIFTFLVGLLVWGFVGKVETKSTVGFSVTDGNVTCYISETDYNSYIKGKDSDYIEDIILRFEDKEIAAENVSSLVQEVTSESVSFLLRAANIGNNDLYYVVTSHVSSIVNGNYKGSIVFESTKPISYLF